MRSYFEYYFRIYQSGITALNTIKDPDYLAAVRDAVKKYDKMFDYTKFCQSKNLRLLSKLKKLFGTRFACKLILKRYKR